MRTHTAKSNLQRTAAQLAADFHLTPKAGAQRPFKTLYFESSRSDGWSGQGSAGSEEGAIRAAVVRVFLGQYQRAEIHDQGVLIYTIYRTGKGITIAYGGSKLQ
jgi:hypothetical protein